MKKEIIYIICIVVLIISIISIITLKINYNNKTNNIDNNLVNNSWIKDYSEYHRDINAEYQDEPIENTYINVKETSLEFCIYNENNESKCNEYRYSIDENILTIYESNNNKTTYTYEVKNNNKLILIYDNEGSVWTSYYNKSQG